MWCLRRSYALQHSGVKVIWDAGNEIFKKQLEAQPEILHRIISGLLGTVESYRCALLFPCCACKSDLSGYYYSALRRACFSAQSCVAFRPNNVRLH
jgi:hypothetical protein